MSDVRNIASECKFDAKGNLDLSQIQSEALQNIIKNQCLPTPKSVTEKPSPATKTAEAPPVSIPTSKTSGGVTPINEKIKKELESFSETNAATYEALKNIEKTFGVSVVQNFERAKYEAKLNGATPENNNAFIKGFLREYAVQMYAESKKTTGYSEQIDAGRLAAGMPPLVHKKIDFGSYYSTPLPVIKNSNINTNDDEVQLF
jgi:hypothetical protein